MSCLQTLSGLARDCEQNIGGIKNIWIANFDDVTGIALDDDDEAIVEIDMATSGAPAVARKFKKYRMRKGAANFTSTLNVDAASGVSYYGTDVILQFNKMSIAKYVEMKALSVAELRVIVEDNNGARWFLGKDNAVIAGAGDAQTGAAMGDANRYTITLHDDEPSLPVPINMEDTDWEAIVDEA